MADQVLEALRQPELINYLRAFQGPMYLGDELFPGRLVNELDYKYLVGANNLPVMASITALDAEAPARSRRGPITVVQGEIPAIKHKRSLDAKTLYALLAPRPGTSEFEQAIRDLYDDATALREGVRARIEYLRMMALTTGGITISDPDSGVRLSATFGVPPTQQITCDGQDSNPDPWDDADNRAILDNLETWTNLVEENSGIRPTRMLTSRYVVNLMLKDATIRDAVWNQASSRRPIVQEDLSELLDRMGLPPEILVYEQRVQLEAANGTFTSLRLFPQNLVVLLPPDKLGDTLQAVPVEALQSPDNVATVTLDAERIALTTWQTVEPPARWVRGSALAFPTFPRANEILIADVDPA